MNIAWFYTGFLVKRQAGAAHIAPRNMRRATPLIDRLVVGFLMGV